MPNWNIGRLKCFTLARSGTAIAFVLALTGSAAQADVAAMKRGLGSLAAGKYQEAADAFSSEIKNDPTNVQAHYCLAVCHHFSGRYADANREYIWVCKNTKDPQLCRRAEKGIAGVKTYLAAAPPTTVLSTKSPSESPATQGEPQGNSFASSSFEMPSPSLSNSAPLSGKWADAAGARAATGSAFGSGNPQSATESTEQVNSAPLSSGWGSASRGRAPAESTFGSANRPMATVSTDGARVVDVYAVWCGPCKQFAPVFRGVGDRFSSSGVIFESLDAEAPENKAFIEKYDSEVNSFPTVLFIDGYGNVIKKFTGYRDSSAFNEEVLKVWPQLAN